jgi:hypothetical protein
MAAGGDYKFNQEDKDDDVQSTDFSSEYEFLQFN